MATQLAHSQPGSLRLELRLDPSPKRIRVVHDGECLVDTIGASLGYATGRHPDYLMPADDVEWGRLLVETAAQSDPFGSYHAIQIDSSRVTIGKRHVDGAAAGLVSFDFDRMDAWFEEDEQIHFHPRDPYRRVEVIESSRQVEVTVNGELLACSDRPRLVTETGLPARWYIPRIDVDWSKLVPSTTSSGCQYKGDASWWHVEPRDGDRLTDVVWGYDRPIPEASKLAGLVAFYAEHVDVETFVNGERQHKPRMDSSALNPSLGLHNVAV